MILDQEGALEVWYTVIQHQVTTMYCIFRSVQLKMVSMRSVKPIRYAVSLRVSEVSLMLSLK